MLFLRTELTQRIIQLALGVLLLTAAGLKLYGQSVSAVPSVGWFATPGVQFATVLWEIGLGLSLLVGSGKVVLWSLSAITFAIFAGVSGYLGLQGVANCGCFGVIKASPWHAFAVDMTALVLLVITRPALDLSSEAIRATALRGTALVGGSAVVLAMLAVGGTLAFGSLPNALAKLRGESLGAPQYVDFGTSQPGKIVGQSITVVNYTSDPVRLIGGTSDCSCITTSTMPIMIPPNESQSVAIKLKIAANATSGQFTRTAEIWTDCDRQRTLRVRLSCRVEAE